MYKQGEETSRKRHADNLVGSVAGAKLVKKNELAAKSAVYCQKNNVKKLSHAMLIKDKCLT